MRITGTEMTLQSDHAAFAETSSREALHAWRGERPAAASKPQQTARLERSIVAFLSQAAWDALRTALEGESSVPPAPTFREMTPAGTQEATSVGDALDNDPVLSLVRRMIEMLTGEKVRVLDLGSFTQQIRHVETEQLQVQSALRASPARGADFGLEYGYQAVREEAEATSLAASGAILTADGRTINFRLELEMSRIYREEISVGMRAGNAVRKDPLVINFGGTAAQLAEEAGRFFRFDLDGDGKQEMLPLFSSGSGYLALDLNRNGLIDSGKELFGPTSGSGFDELARLDADGNGWIDEGDAEFDKLFVWTPDTEGIGELRSLAEMGVGALSLTHVASPFGLRSSSNRDLGLVKSTGVYLAESGKPGSMQEIDLTV